MAGCYQIIMSFWKRNYTTKKGYLTHKGYPLRRGTLITFTNGLVIVRDEFYDNEYEVDLIHVGKYKVINSDYEFFLVAE